MNDVNKGKGKKSDTTSSAPPSRRGYKPLHEGYTPSEKKGYAATTSDSSGLPKAPKGGTGETPAATQANDGGDASSAPGSSE